MKRWYVPLIAAMVLAAVPASAQLQIILTDFEEYELGLNGKVMFRVPRLSGSTSGFLETSPNLSVISDEQALSGTQSLKVSFQFKPNQNDPWMRLTTFNAEILPNPIIPVTLPLSVGVYVPSGTPDFLLTLGVRETNPTGNIGENGGTSGTIEFIGAPSKSDATNAPVGIPITVKDQWVEVIFNPLNDPITGYTGNGVLETTTGKVVLEHLAFTPVDSSLVGPYTIYLDRLAVVPEPATLSMLGLGVVGLLLRRRKA